ncbi:MAG: phage baseplate assembly protein V [Thalassobaculaceae bacterium]
MDVNRAISRLTGPLRRRIANTVGRAIIRLVDDATRTQLVQLTALADETHDRVERFQEYGFTSRPHPGAHAILVALGGNRTHAVVVGVEDPRYRLFDLETGEVALYTDEDQLPGGHALIFRRGQKVELRAGSEVRITVGDGATQLIMTPDGTRLITPDVAVGRDEGEAT